MFNKPDLPKALCFNMILSISACLDHRRLARLQGHYCDGYCWLFEESETKYTKIVLH